MVALKLMVNKLLRFLKRGICYIKKFKYADFEKTLVQENHENQNLHEPYISKYQNMLFPVMV